MTFIELYPTGQLLEHVPAVEELIIPSLDGKTTIWKATKTRSNNFKLSPLKWFKGEKTTAKPPIEISPKIFEEADPYFKSIDYPEPATKEVVVEFFKPTTHAIIRDMLNSLSRDVNSLGFSQHQIVEFCKLHKHHLQNPTFFLYNNPAGERAIVEINNYDNLLLVDCRSFNSPEVIKLPPPPERTLVTEGKSDYIYERIYTSSNLIVLPKME